MVTRLKDVAQRANVSICTVSKLLNGAPGSLSYSKECSERVWRAARELGYQPNYHARSLRAGKSQALGIVLPRDTRHEAGAWFLSAMLTSVDLAARARGYHSVIIGAKEDELAVESGVRFLQERRIDSLVVPGYFCNTPALLKPLEDARLPIVMLHLQPPTSLPVVEVDTTVGMREAVTHLAGLGHRRVLWMGPATVSHAYPAERHEAFVAATRERQMETAELRLTLPEELRAIRLEDEIGLARNALLDCLRADDSCTAVVCYHEAMAFGAYAAATALGWQIPRDLSVVGFDDVGATLAYPPMTVVSHMLPEASDQAVAWAVEMGASGDVWESMRHRRERIASRLVVRGSTGPATLASRPLPARSAAYL